MKDKQPNTFYLLELLFKGQFTQNKKIQQNRLRFLLPLHTKEVTFLGGKKKEIVPLNSWQAVLWTIHINGDIVSKKTLFFKCNFSMLSASQSIHFTVKLLIDKL